MKYFNYDFQSFLLAQGISQQTFCVGTPQTGRVERRHRKLLSHY